MRLQTFAGEVAQPLDKADCRDMDTVVSSQPRYTSTIYFASVFTPPSNRTVPGHIDTDDYKIGVVAVYVVQEVISASGMS